MSTSPATDSRAAPVPRMENPPRQRGAYGLVQDNSGRVLVVEADNGRCYLPGGRLEPGETPRQALAREIEEECGWSAEILAPLAERDQTIFGGRVALAASYWRARLTRPAALAPEHRTLWLEVGEAARRLHREGDRALVTGAG